MKQTQQPVSIPERPTQDFDAFQKGTGLPQEGTRSSLQVYTSAAHQNKALNIIITLIATMFCFGIWYMLSFIEPKRPFAMDQAIRLLLIQGLWGTLLVGLPILGGSISIIKAFKQHEDKKAYTILTLVGLYFFSIWPVVIYLDMTDKTDQVLQTLAEHQITVAIFPAFLFWILLYVLIKTVLKT